MGDQFNSKDFIIGTVIGSLAGVAAALLLAPKSGREIRGDINQGASQMKDRADEWIQIAQEKGSSWKDKAYTTSSEIKRKAMDTTSQVAKNVTVKTKDVENKVQKKTEETISQEQTPAEPEEN